MGSSRLTRQPERGEWLGGETNGDLSPSWLVIHFTFPVVDFVETGQGEIALYTASSSLFRCHAYSIGEEGNLRAGLDNEGRIGFIIWLK